MPANLKELRGRIKSVKSTQQITKAMKLVSAAKFGRAQNAVLNSRPYAKELAALTSKLAGIVSGGCQHPLMNASTSKTALILVLASERGLCGGYNANVTKQALKTAKDLEQEGLKVALVCIGKKSFQAFLRRRRLSSQNSLEPAYLTEESFIHNPASFFDGDGLSLINSAYDKPTNLKAKKLADAFAELYTQGKIGRLVVVYNKFQSAMSQIPTAETVLPLKINSPSQIVFENSSAETLQARANVAEPIFEPEIDDLLGLVLPRYMVSRIFQTLLEAVASEHGARMSAMDSATRNAQEMQRKLQITYQRARQAAITNELIEIISGAEAL